MANTLLASVIDTLAPYLDADGTIDLEKAVDLVSDLDFSSRGLDPMGFFEEMDSVFEIDNDSRTLRVIGQTADDEPSYADESDPDAGVKKYPIPPRDFQFNGRLIKLMNAMADENTPPDGLYFAQFAKAAKEHDLAIPPHEEKLLSYLRLYPKVFTITVDPSASQKIFIRPIKGFKSYKKDRRVLDKPAFGAKPHNTGFQPAQHMQAPVKDRTLSLYSLKDFAYFPDLVSALRKLHDMAAPAEGCFEIEGDVNPYRMYWNKLERDFAEAIRREYNESEQLFLMSPVGADFPTGFTTPEGKRIFAACEFNKLRNADSYQAWRFSDFYAEEENA